MESIGMKKEEVPAKTLGSEKKYCRVRAIRNCGERSDTNIASIFLGFSVTSRHELHGVCSLLPSKLLPC